VTAWKDRHFLKHKTKNMFNTLLEKQAYDAKYDINSLIDDLVTEIHELEESLKKLEDKIDDLEEQIEGHKAEWHELKNK
jgi:cell division septum initiation protein DivIVA